MTDSAIDAKRKAAEHAIANGGVPLDPYPGYLTWFVRKCVDRGAASGLDWLCRMFPEHEEAILDHWCRLACGPGNLWAWREARARLEVLVSRGEDIPLPLARFAIESPPRDKPGPNPEGSRAVLIDGVMRVLESEGLDAQEVNAQFGASFPGKAKYPGDTLRDRRELGRRYVARAFEAGSDDEFVASAPSRPLAIAVDWAHPDEAAVTLLKSGWPAFALMWDFWPAQREAHLRLWYARARREAWVWDELRALLDHGVYCGWSLPPPLRASVGVPRPANPAGRRVKYGRWLRVAAIEARCAEAMRSQRAAEYLVGAVFKRLRTLRDEGRLAASWPDLGLDLDTSTVGKHFISSREQLGGVIASPPS